VFLKWTVSKNRFLKIKKAELICRWCRGAAAAGAIVVGAVMEKPMLLDQTNKRSKVVAQIARRR
jgi:hypothetical protein